MIKARNGGTINTEAVRNYLQPEWDKRAVIRDILIQDPLFDKSERPFLTRTEKFHRGLRLANRIFELQVQHRWSNDEVGIALLLVVLDEALAITLHLLAFEPVFNLTASHSLRDKYSRLISTRGIIGCYLQTELAHGTNLLGLETTATYIPETREFEIHSPRLESSKWWVGGLGKLATHGVIQAKLILNGKNYGPHLFFIQLRSLHDHRLLPGITAGDIGPKAFGGVSAIDNGFARFDHVRIPKEHMLSRFSKVDEAGKYVKPLHDKLGYGGMLFIRSTMVTTAGWQTARAATISIRYATVRRQGHDPLSPPSSPDQLETQIINYPSVHTRLLPILSHAYVFFLLGPQLSRSFQTMAQRLEQGDASLLAELHALASGLKVLCTSMSIQDIETARRSMGGHGYSAFSGLDRLYAESLPSATFEGENFVLDQQVIRSALKTFHSLISNSQLHSAASALASLPPSSRYLRHLVDPNNDGVPPLLDEPTCWQDPKTSVMLLEWRAAMLVHELAHTLKKMDSTILQRVSKAVTEAFVGARVVEFIEDLEKKELMGTESVRVVGRLFNLYLLTTVENALADLYTFNLLRFKPGKPREEYIYNKGPRDPARNLRLAISQLCIELLPNAIALTDAFGFTDWELDSALGRYDGRVYEALWEAANKLEPLNRSEVSEMYDELIKPMLLRGQKAAGVDKAKL